MPTRIANFAANNQILSYMLRAQRDLHQAEIQVTSEKVAQNYSGIHRQAESLINVENTRARLAGFSQNNDQMDLKLKIQETVVENIRKTISDFQKQITTFNSNDVTNAADITAIQDDAFRALKNMQSFLNTDIDGQYLFSGSRVNEQPVSFNFADKAALQSTYDGVAVFYPVTREAHVDTSVTLTNTQTGNITFPDANTIRATTEGSFNGIAVGSTITLTGSVAGGGANNKTYTVANVSNDGRDLTINGNINHTGSDTVTVTNSVDTSGGAEAGITITANSYYNGDRVTQIHRVSRGQQFGLDTNAIDPAFEKAMRAMAIMAQGNLANDADRASQVLTLLDMSLDPPASTASAFASAEKDNTIQQVQVNLGFNRVMIERANETNTALLGFFDDKIIQTENQDMAEAITRLMDQTRALEASYQALARIRELSLTKFI